MDPKSLLSNLKRTFSGFGSQTPTTAPAPFGINIPRPIPFAMPKPSAIPTMGPTPAPTPSQSVSTAFIGPVRPEVPTVRPPVVTAPPPPVAPKTTSTGQTINTATGGVVSGATTPTPPVPPAPIPETPTPTVPTAEQSAVTSAEQAYRTAGMMTPEEEAAQVELDRLQESFKKGYLGVGEQAIPMGFITGQEQALEQRALSLAEPLTKKLARLEAKRLSGLETSKFALERADKAAEAARTAETAKATATESARRFAIEQQGAEATRKLAEKKFAEDTRQFGLDYAIKQRDIALKEAEKKPTTSATQTQSIERALQAAKDAEKYAGASGQANPLTKAWRWATGSESFTDLQAQANTLRTLVMTLQTDPNTKKFFGPAMSNADVQFLMSGGTTLNPELQSPTELKAEIGRIKNALNVMKISGASAPSSAGGTGSSQVMYGGVMYNVDANGDMTPA